MTVNQQQIAALIKSHFQIPLQLDFHIFETLPSTNQTLWQLINQGATAGTVVIALQQTAGRGQWGRQWSSPMGGLYLSLALATNLPAVDSSQLTLCSVWGIATALRDCGIPVLIKWPNDLILGGRKLGGILTETRVQQGQITRAIVGVGINWTNATPETGINLQSFLKEQSNPILTSLEELTALTLKGLLSGYEQASTAGIETLLPSYLELLTSKGRQVVVEGRSGVVVGVTPTGELQVCFDTDSAP